MWSRPLSHCLLPFLLSALRFIPYHPTPIIDQSTTNTTFIKAHWSHFVNSRTFGPDRWVLFGIVNGQGMTTWLLFELKLAGWCKLDLSAANAQRIGLQKTLHFSHGRIDRATAPWGQSPWFSMWECEVWAFEVWAFDFWLLTSLLHMCSKGAMTGEMTLFRHTFLNRFI
jgi:hypothetical protein